MNFEFRVNDLAAEFNVHRNTIRNWINSGLLPAKKTAGRRYHVPWTDYNKLCEKFGYKAKQPPTDEPDREELQAMTARSTPVPLLLQPSRSSFFNDPSLADICVGCGSCASSCPISGVDGMDPRKLVRMAILNIADELISLEWPWKCTLCGRCEQACPVGVEIVQLIRRLRSARKRDLVPGFIQQGVSTCLEQGNNIGIPKKDFLNLLKEVQDATRAITGPGFKLPIDVHGARLLVTINSKLPFIEPEALQWWWQIFFAAGESWTTSSDNWEGVNWGYFSGDDGAAKTMVGRIVDNMERLGCRALLLPECGHAAHATLTGMQKWFPQALQQYTIYTTLDLLSDYIKSKRLQVVPGLFYQRTTYHDSCHYSRNAWATHGRNCPEQGRAIVQICCPHFVEMYPNKRDNYCCGGGGGTMATSFTEEPIFHGRIKARQIRESGAKIVVTPCPTCRDQLQSVLNREFDLDILVQLPWQLIAQSLICNEQPHTDFDDGTR